MTWGLDALSLRLTPAAMWANGLDLRADATVRTLRHISSRDLINEVILEISGRLPDFLETPPRCCNGEGGYKEWGAEMRSRGQYPPLQSPFPDMWFNRPAYSSYTPRYGYGYSSFENPHARAIARERAAREREAAAHRANLLRWQQMQDAARSPYNSYLSDDDEDTFVSYPYNLRAQNYVAHEDLKRQQILEQQRQLELARRADRREAKRVRELAEHTPKLQEVSFVECRTSDHHGNVSRC